MDYHFDVVMIGGGPAGTSCGITLQKEKVSSCIIDKRRFPRKKACGGLITQKTLDAIKDLLPHDDFAPSLFCGQCCLVDVYHGQNLLASAETDERFMFIKRESFDSQLVSIYQKLGGIIFEGIKDYTINYKEKVILLADGDRIRYHDLVGADGALSRVRTDFGLPVNSMGFCIETFVPKAAAELPEHIGLYFGIVKNGYAWVFPSGDDYCIGLGGVYDNTIQYRELLESFLRELGIKNDCPMSGAFIPYGGVVDQSPLPHDVILVGDAAGLVDPISGEGLYFSIRSGVEAAYALKTASPQKTYLRAIKPIRLFIRRGKMLQKVFFSDFAQRAFPRLIGGRSDLLKRYCDRQISHYAFFQKSIVGMVVRYVVYALKHR